MDLNNFVKKGCHKGQPINMPTPHQLGASLEHFGELAAPTNLPLSRWAKAQAVSTLANTACHEWTSDDVWAERQVVNAAPRVYTHAGQFHADEVLACALLSIAHGQRYVGFVRDAHAPETGEAQAGDWVVDIGGQFGLDALGVMHADHHQWKHGDAACALVHKLLMGQDTHEGRTYRKALGAFTKQVDLLVHGVSLNDTGEAKPDAKWFSFSAMVRAFNGLNTAGPEQDAAFVRVVEWVRAWITQAAYNFNTSNEEFELLLKSAEVCGGVAVFKRSCPAAQLVSASEEHHSVKIVVYPSDRTGWIAQTVEDQGVRRAELQDVREIELIFVHSNNFMRVYKTEADARMAASVSAR